MSHQPSIELVRTRAKLHCDLLCLRMNKDGSPAHPLYLPGDLTLKEWRPTK